MRANHATNVTKRKGGQIRDRRKDGGVRNEVDCGDAANL